MSVTEHVGDIFKAPEGSVLMHACNCQGSWGSGVAAAFAEKFPAARDVYKEHCKVPDTVEHKKSLAGTTLLIPPQARDVKRSGSYWIACLMTSVHYGKKKDSPDAIIENTRDALTDLKQQLKELEAQNDASDMISQLYTIRINSAAFDVPWASTMEVLKQSLLSIHVINNINVMRPKDRALVLEDMKAAGYDTANDIDFTKTTTNSGESKDIGTPGAGNHKRLASEVDADQESNSKEAQSGVNDHTTKKTSKKVKKTP